MFINNFLKLFLAIFVSTFSTQTTYAFLHHIDVLAKIVPMPDGTKRVDVAIIGSDRHKIALTPENASHLLLTLAKNFDSIPQKFEVLVEHALSGYKNLGASQELQKLIENKCIENLSVLSSFDLLEATYEKIEPTKPFIENIKKIKVVNLDHRIQTHPHPNICLDSQYYKEYLELRKKAVSENFLNEVTQQLAEFKDADQYNYDLYNASNFLWEQTSLSIDDYKRAVCKNIKMNSGNFEASYQSIVEDIFNNQEQSNRKIICYFKEIVPLDATQNLLFSTIESRAFEKIMKIDCRDSTRTLSLMGSFHSNPKIISGSEDVYGLVDYLENNGYTKIDCLQIVKTQDDLEKLICNQNTNWNELINQTSQFILEWLKADDSTVLQRLQSHAHVI